jgi:hypothetical protein
MKKTAYGNPILLKENQTELINKVEFKDELSIQNLVFDYPKCIPVSDIDEAYNPIISVCKELNTPVGPLDIFMITPNGDIAIVETKLWRNPESRRKVIAQILDYANELSNWTYEDLQREINRKLKRKGNTLYEIIKEKNPNSLINEADFVDNVSRNLNRGKFLLIIIGDGIKEGAMNIANFLSSSAHLNFIFGMVELTLYQIDKKTKIVLPRTIVKTNEVQKFNIELPEGLMITNTINQNINVKSNKTKIKPELVKRREFFRKFWDEFLLEFDLDDPGQALPKPSITQNLFLYMDNNKSTWISAYFAQSTNRVGVYFRGGNNNSGKEIMTFLYKQFGKDIENELGDNVIWHWKKEILEGFSVRLSIDDVYSNENRENIKDFFKVWINNFVNVLRPRMKEINKYT